jgi:hypothetical protein
MGNRMGRSVCMWVAVLLLGLRFASAETCTTQSEMTQGDRDRLVAAGLALAEKVQANDVDGLRGLALPEYDKDPGPMTRLVASLAPKLAGASLVVEQVYLLDASGLHGGIGLSDSRSTGRALWVCHCPCGVDQGALEPGVPAAPGAGMGDGGLLS